MKEIAAEKLSESTQERKAGVILLTRDRANTWSGSRNSRITKTRGRGGCATPFDLCHIPQLFPTILSKLIYSSALFHRNSSMDFTFSLSLSLTIERNRFRRSSSDL